MNDEEKQTPELIRTRWGFYQYRPLPSDEELQEYYANHYYQQGLGSYAVSYSEEEKKWFRLRSRILYKKAMDLLQGGSLNCIDVGCGEGWLLAEFFRNGCDVRGLDFSKEGISKFNPQLLSSFFQGNIYQLLDEIIAKGEKYQVITLINVIEHVKYPEQLLDDLKAIMAPDSLLLVFAPNDFSTLHAHLEEKGFIDRQWWLKYPDHLSYFNRESMTELMKDRGFEVRSIVGDHPIDLNLLNDNSNYVVDSDKGPNTHNYRVRYDNFLGSIDQDKLLKLYEVFGSMGIGRNLAYYCTLAP